eukprot:GILJ01005771.1.p1 GENE.GILJ01005771.1~~GILJ01005771.1.p1  ORF type:complete len:2593 (-),score=466.03 GILJ01005771.1:108-7886(-)
MVYNSTLPPLVDKVFNRLQHEWYDYQESKVVYRNMQSRKAGQPLMPIVKPTCAHLMDFLLKRCEYDSMRNCINGYREYVDSPYLDYPDLSFMERLVQRPFDEMLFPLYFDVDAVYALRAMQLTEQLAVMNEIITLSERGFRTLYGGVQKLLSGPGRWNTFYRMTKNVSGHSCYVVFSVMVRVTAVSLRVRSLQQVLRIHDIKLNRVVSTSAEKKIIRAVMAEQIDFDSVWHSAGYPHITQRYGYVPRVDQYENGVVVAVAPVYFANVSVDSYVVPLHSFSPSAAFGRLSNEYYLQRLQTSEASAILVNMLTRLPSLSIQLSDQEMQVVTRENNVLALGRSGTGKTTCAVLRMFSRERLFANASKGRPLLFDLRDPNCESTCNLHCLFVTASPVLCHEVDRYYKDLTEKTVKRRKPAEATTSSNISEPAHESAAEPTPEQHAFMDADLSADGKMDAKKAQKLHSLLHSDDSDFPMFLTIRKLLIMLDGTVPHPFFARDADGRVLGMNEQCSWHNEGRGMLLLVNKKRISSEVVRELDIATLEDGIYNSDDEDEVEIERTIEHATVAEEAVEGFEIDYDYFVDKIWPRLQRNARSTVLSPLTVWTEIVAYIKGSEASRALTEEEYLGRGRFGSLLDPAIRLTIYQMFLCYERIKDESNAYDQADLIYHIYNQMLDDGYHGAPIHYMCVDEVQDLTHACIELLMMVCEQPNGLFFSGDTCQTIAKGVGFRFCDLANLFRAKIEQRGLFETTWQLPVVQHLTVNFRSHGRLLDLSNSIVVLLQSLFPQTIDHLEREKGTTSGPVPLVFSSCPEDVFFLLLSSSNQDGGYDQPRTRVEFGANQVILVRDQQAKDKLPEILRHALCMTIYEAKGLEFDDVILYNFWQDSALDESTWQVIRKVYGDLENNVEAHNTCLRELAIGFQEEEEENANANAEPTLLEPMSMLDSMSGSHRIPTSSWFDPFRNALLCSELKHLYTACTRAKNRLFVYDSVATKREQIEAYWSKCGLVEVVDLTPAQEAVQVESIADTLQNKLSRVLTRSSPAEWREQGLRMLRHGYYAQAEKCFTMSQDENLLRQTKAFRMADEAVQARIGYAAQKSFKESAARKKRPLQMEIKKYATTEQHYFNSMLESFAQAGSLFASCSLYAQAARCFFSARQWSQAAEMFMQCGKLSEAGFAYMEMSEYVRAAECFEQCGDLVRCVECYDKAHRYTDILRTLKQQHALDLALISNSNNENNTSGLPSLTRQSSGQSDFVNVIDQERVASATAKPSRAPLNLKKTVSPAGPAVDPLQALALEYIPKALHGAFYGTDSTTESTHTRWESVVECAALVSSECGSLLKSSRAEGRSLVNMQLIQAVFSMLESFRLHELCAALCELLVASATDDWIVHQISEHIYRYQSLAAHQMARDCRTAYSSRVVPGSNNSVTVAAPVTSRNQGGGVSNKKNLMDVSNKVIDFFTNKFNASIETKSRLLLQYGLWHELSQVLVAAISLQALKSTEQYTEQVQLALTAKQLWDDFNGCQALHSSLGDSAQITKTYGLIVLTQAVETFFATVRNISSAKICPINDTVSAQLAYKEELNRLSVLLDSAETLLLMTHEATFARFKKFLIWIISSRLESEDQFKEVDDMLAYVTTVISSVYCHSDDSSTDSDDEYDLNQIMYFILLELIQLESVPEPIMCQLQSTLLSSLLYSVRRLAHILCDRTTKSSYLHHLFYTMLKPFYVYSSPNISPFPKSYCLISSQSVLYPAVIPRLRSEPLTASSKLHMDALPLGAVVHAALDRIVVTVCNLVQDTCSDLQRYVYSNVNRLYQYTEDDTDSLISHLNRVCFQVIEFHSNSASLMRAVSPTSSASQINSTSKGSKKNKVRTQITADNILQRLHTFATQCCDHLLAIKRWQHGIYSLVEPLRHSVRNMMIAVSVDRWKKAVRESDAEPIHPNAMVSIFDSIHSVDGTLIFSDLVLKEPQATGFNLLADIAAYNRYGAVYKSLGTTLELLSTSCRSLNFDDTMDLLEPQLIQGLILYCTLQNRYCLVPVGLCYQFPQRASHDPDNLDIEITLSVGSCAESDLESLLADCFVYLSDLLKSAFSDVESEEDLERTMYRFLCCATVLAVNMSAVQLADVYADLQSNFATATLSLPSSSMLHQLEFDLESLLNSESVSEHPLCVMVTNNYGKMERVGLACPPTPESEVESTLDAAWNAEQALIQQRTAAAHKLSQHMHKNYKCMITSLLEKRYSESSRSIDDHILWRTLTDDFNNDAILGAHLQTHTFSRITRVMNELTSVRINLLSLMNQIPNASSVEYTWFESELAQLLVQEGLLRETVKDGLQHVKETDVDYVFLTPMEGVDNQDGEDEEEDEDVYMDADRQTRTATQHVLRQVQEMRLQDDSIRESSTETDSFVDLADVGAELRSESEEDGDAIMEEDEEADDWSDIGFNDKSTVSVSSSVTSAVLLSPLKSAATMQTSQTQHTPPFVPSSGDFDTLSKASIGMSASVAGAGAAGVFVAEDRLAPLLSTTGQRLEERLQKLSSFVVDVKEKLTTINKEWQMMLARQVDPPAATSVATAEWRKQKRERLEEKKRTGRKHQVALARKGRRLHGR